MDLYLKPDGAWHLSPEQVEWLNGAQEREAALREENARLRAEIVRLRAIISPGDAAAFEEHMAAREMHWMAEVKRLEKLILAWDELMGSWQSDLTAEAKRIRGER